MVFSPFQLGYNFSITLMVSRKERECKPKENLVGLTSISLLALEVFPMTVMELSQRFSNLRIWK